MPQTFNLSAGFVPKPVRRDKTPRFNLTAGLVPTPKPAPVSPDSLTANPDKEGVYSLTRDGHTVDVPYSKVAKARKEGYEFADSATNDRYDRDFAADPARHRSETPGGEQIVQQETGIHPYRSPAAQSVMGPIRAVVGILEGPWSMAKAAFEPPTTPQEAAWSATPGGLAVYRMIVKPTEDSFAASEKESHGFESEAKMLRHLSQTFKAAASNPEKREELQKRYPQYDLSTPQKAEAVARQIHRTAILNRVHGYESWLGATPVLGGMGERSGARMASGDIPGAVTEAAANSLLLGAPSVVAEPLGAARDAALDRVRDVGEGIRTRAQNLVGTGTRHVGHAVRDEAKKAGLAAKATEESNRAALSRYEDDLKEAGQKNINAHVKWLQSKAQVEKDNIDAQNAVEEYNRAQSAAYDKDLSEAARANAAKHVKFLKDKAETSRANAEAAKNVEEHNRAELDRYERELADAQRKNTEAHVKYLSDKAEAEHANDAARAIPDARAGLENYIQKNAENLDVRVEKARHEAMEKGNAMFAPLDEKLGSIPADGEVYQDALNNASEAISGTGSLPDTTLINQMQKNFQKGDTVTYGDLQADYTRIGREMAHPLPGRVYHAYDKLQEAIGGEMQRIADSKGMGSRLKHARDYWHRMAQAYYPSSDAVVSRAGKAVSSTAPDMAEAQTRDFRYRLLGKFDPEIPEIADRIESARRRLDALPSEGIRPTAKIPEEPTEITVEPPKLRKPPAPKESPDEPRDVEVEPPKFKRASEPKSSPAAPEESVVDAPKLNPIETPELNTREIRNRLLNEKLAQWTSLGKYQVERLAAGPLGVLIGVATGHPFVEIGSGIYALAELSPFLLRRMVDNEALRSFFTRPPAGELESLQKIPYADRVKIVDGMKQVIRESHKMKKTIRVSPRLLSLIVATDEESRKKRRADASWNRQQQDAASLSSGIDQINAALGITPQEAASQP